MLEKVVNYIRKKRRWRRFAPRLHEFSTLDQFKAFLGHTGCAPYLTVHWMNLSAHNRAEAEDVLARYALDVRGRRVLDIGAGYGDFLDVCRERGAVTVGTDYDPFVVRWLQLRGHLAFLCNILRSFGPLDGNSFDIVHLKESIVVEYFHLLGMNRLHGFLANVDRLCAPGARVIIRPYFEISGPDRRRKVEDPLNCPFTHTMLAAGYKIMDPLPGREDDPVCPVTYGKTA